MRSIKKIHKAEFRPMEGLVTYSPLPTRQLQQIDPFIFLNHHGPQKFPPNNRGLPFGPHPHRGMETVTFILEGDIEHKDSGGHSSTINAGGIQWMTAGSGLIHAETSSQKFKQEGGDLEILQLWLNLPSHLKLTEPDYIGLQKEDIPVVELSEDGKIAMQLISGNVKGQKGAVESKTGINLGCLHFKAGSCDFRIPEDHNIFFYVVSGLLSVNGSEVENLSLVEFNNDDNKLQIEVLEKGTAILGYAKAFNEPVVAQGPFVMNTEEEIAQAYRDFREGKMGSWG